MPLTVRLQLFRMTDWPPGLATRPKVVRRNETAKYVFLQDPPGEDVMDLRSLAYCIYSNYDTLKASS